MTHALAHFRSHLVRKLWGQIEQFDRDEKRIAPEDKEAVIAIKIALKACIDSLVKIQ